MAPVLHRINNHRLAGYDYSDPSRMVFITLVTKIRAMAPESMVDPAAPFTSCPPLARQSVESLHFYRTKGRWQLFAYCVMPDHVHLLCVPSKGMNLSDTLGFYQRYLTHTAWHYGVVGPLWERSFYDHVLRAVEAAPRVVEDRQSVV